MSATNKLVEIPHEKLPVLRDMYRNNWPINQITYYTIDNYINWFNKNRTRASKSVTVYSLNGDFSDGTFIIMNRTFVSFNTLNENYDRLYTALSLADYSKPRTLNGFSSKLLPFVQRFLKDNQQTVDSLKCETVLYFYPREEALKFEISSPKGIVLKRLTEAHAKEANEIWPHRRNGSLPLLKDLIRYNINIGAFKTDTDELVAWCLRLVIGSLGVLHVKEEYKRQGFGSLLVKAMSRELASLGIDAFAPVVTENTPSRQMFEKLGFKEVDKIYWIPVKSTGTYEWNDDDSE